MKHYLILILLSFTFFACDSDEVVDQGSAMINTNSSAAGDDVVEVGDVEEEAVATFTGVEDACDLFDENAHLHASLFKDVFPKASTKCSSLSLRQKNSFMTSHEFINDLLDGYNNEAHKNCPKYAKRVLRKMRLLVMRSLRVQENDDRDIRLEKNKLTEKRLKRIVRRMVKDDCLDSFRFPQEVSYNDVTFTFSDDQNFILNSSFAIFKQDRGLTRIEDGWTIINSSQIPGWRVRATQDNAPGVDCSFLEVQASGVTASSTAGHVVELDGHCENDQGRRVGGNATVEITQRFLVPQAGAYRLIVAAQKRGGTYGDLETAIFHKKKHKVYTQHALNSDRQWQEVCVDFETEKENKFVTVAVKDGNTTDRKTYGLLVDEVRFEEGSCE